MTTEDSFILTTSPWPCPHNGPEYSSLGCYTCHDLKRKSWQYTINNLRLCIKGVNHLLWVYFGSRREGEIGTPIELRAEVCDKFLESI